MCDFDENRKYSGYTVLICCIGFCAGTIHSYLIYLLYFKRKYVVFFYKYIHTALRNPKITTTIIWLPIPRAASLSSQFAKYFGSRVYSAWSQSETQWRAYNQVSIYGTRNSCRTQVSCFYVVNFSIQRIFRSRGPQNIE